MSLVLQVPVVYLDFFLIIVQVSLYEFSILILSVAFKSRFLYLFFLRFVLFASYNFRLQHNLIYLLSGVFLGTVFVKLQVTVHQITTCFTQYNTSFLMSIARSYLLTM